MMIRCSYCGYQWEETSNLKRRVIIAPAGIECPKCKGWTGEPLSEYRRLGQVRPILDNIVNKQGGTR